MKITIGNLQIGFGFYLPSKDKNSFIYDHRDSDYLPEFAVYFPLGFISFVWSG